MKTTITLELDVETGKLAVFAPMETDSRTREMTGDRPTRPNAIQSHNSSFDRRRSSRPPRRPASMLCSIGKW